MRKKCSYGKSVLSPSVLSGKSVNPSQLWLDPPLALNGIREIIKNSNFVEFKLQSAYSRNNFLVISSTFAARCTSNEQIFSISLVLAVVRTHRVRKKSENGPSQTTMVQNLKKILLKLKKFNAAQFFVDLAVTEFCRYRNMPISIFPASGHTVCQTKKTFSM